MSDRAPAIVTAIAAIANEGVLGANGALPWHLPADLQRFKALTRGHHLIVGRKTWESVGRPLPGRTFIVVSRGTPPPGLEKVWVRSVAEGIALARASADDQPFVAGGAGIYRDALDEDLLDRLELTVVHGDVPGDVFFPDFDERRWIEMGRVEHPADDRNEFAMTFRTLERSAR